MARQIVNTRVSPGVYRTSAGALVNRATAQIPRRATGATANTGTNRTSGAGATASLGMAPGQYRGADRSAYQAGQVAGSGSMAPGNYRGAQRKAFQAGQATNPVVTTQPVAQNPVAEQPATPAPETAIAPPVYRGANDFMPADITNSPLYNWRLQQGNEALNKRLAAQGLSGSGAEFSQAVGMTNQITGEETDKAYSNAQREADRYNQQQENEARRLYDEAGRTWDNQFNMTKLYLDQNPMQYAYQGTNQYGTHLGQQGSNNAGYAAGNYNRVQGGGGGPTPVYAPPFAPSPNFSGLNTYNAGQSTNNRNQLLNGLSTWAGGFFG